MEQSTSIAIRSLFDDTVEIMSAIAAQRPARERAAIMRAIQTMRKTQQYAKDLPDPLVALDADPHLAPGIVP